MSRGICCLPPCASGIGPALWLLALLGGCAAPPPAELVGGEIESRTRHAIDRPAGTDFAIPPDVELGDGLDEDEAVALALWNAPELRAELIALQLAEADLEQAGLLPNPVVTLLFPVGAKQLEGTLGWALDALWTRPQRLDLARRSWEATAERLVAVGLDRVRDVRLAFADARAAVRRAAEADAMARLAERRAAIAQRRARDGQVDELESALSEAAAVLERERATELQYLELQTRLDLLALIGADSRSLAVELGSARSLPAVPGLSVLLEDALGTRPEVRAAQRATEAAAARLGWERRNIVRLTAILDANEEGKNGFEIGPGLGLELPLFDRNQAGIARAQAGIEQTAWQYVAVRRRVANEVERSHRACSEAEAALARWRDRALPALEQSAKLARGASQRGAISYAEVLSSETRLVEARLRSIELDAQLRRALAELERAVGRQWNGE